MTAAAAAEAALKQPPPTLTDETVQQSSVQEERADPVPDSLVAVTQEHNDALPSTDVASSDSAPVKLSPAAACLLESVLNGCGDALASEEEDVFTTACSAELVQWLSGRGSGLGSRRAA